MAFKDTRRQKFLSEKDYVANQDWFEDSVRRAQHILREQELIPSAKSSFRWRIASDGLQLLILRYTAGRPIEELRAQLPAVIEDFDVYIANEISPRSANPPRNEADTLEITQLEAYVYVFWLLALCKLLGHDALIPKVMGWVDKTFEFNRGRDILFENVVQALTGKHVETEKVLLHPLPYRPLGRATVYAPEERSALVKELVETWYKHMKPCYWHGTHTEGSSYFGYWAFEAALVTVLWDIDDSSYRDHLVYPKDLVDWYRSRVDSVPDNRSPRTPAGQPCPKEGWWFTPAVAGSRRFFKQGEVMPEVKSDYGSTFWQWDGEPAEPEL
ncbi:PoNe immunity protein domain-containing protein [Ralstonia solanacearum]|uniref:PoNe immunity protein domain-containing protein n=1 Tax=Ralstonia solanacearum TaxID=305 RepID=UPI0001D95F8F|nr:PoNe immunity protein domain-containing protein [Ralstonia solanacearum]CBJ34551.1 conserved hypothethical protein [Ralstonia solanacearum PSI07]